MTDTSDTTERTDGIDPEAEMRGSARKSMSLPMGLRPVGAILSNLSDISVGGIAITSVISIPTGTSVQISLLGNSVNINGTVRHTSQLDDGQYKLGVEFQQPQSGLPELLSKTSIARE